MVDTKRSVQDAMHAYYSRDNESLQRVVEKMAREVERLRAGEDVLKRIRQWDHLDGAGDGPFWKAEIDKALTTVK